MAVSPSLSEFLVAPLSEVVQAAPMTMVYAPGGTRRSAFLQGIEPWSEEYMNWARTKSIASFDLLFQHGVRCLLTPALTPGNLREMNRYSDQIFPRIDWVLAGAESLKAYAERGWRVRLIGDVQHPALQKTVATLARHSPTDPTAPLLCWTVVAEATSPWQQLLAASKLGGVETAADAIQALYGELITPATLYLAFGKPTIDFGIVPPLLLGDLQCYWTQQPGYSLDQKQVRTIFHDYAYLRRTWRTEKLERAKAVLHHRHAWENGPILGIGQRLGPFWHPVPTVTYAHDCGEASSVV